MKAKTLEWEQTKDKIICKYYLNNKAQNYYSIDEDFGLACHIDSFDGKIKNIIMMDYYDSVEQAKQAAQEHFNNFVAGLVE